ncbi:hypothetical protein [Paludisphaera soli]|uniref:hypothetical protein n=1 Tax=Paludisphaera soli TaxID=2712865 RepID=UPI0013EBDE86|nr:hypothetical protein [Paludisphaera soli]
MMDARASQRLDDLGRLIEAHGRMNELREQLLALDDRIDAARAYFGAAGANLALARGFHERLMARRRDAAARLRAVRRRAHERLGLAAPAA